MMSSPNLSIIIPAYNEAGSLHELYSRICQVLKGHRPFEIIIVNDGSTDNSFELLEDMKRSCPHIKVIHHRLKAGKSLAIMQGLELATGEVALLMDADLQNRPENIPLILEKLDEGHDLVNGLRDKRKDGLARKFISSIFNRLVQRTLDIDLHDINCGFKGVRKEYYKRLELRGDMHRLLPVLVRDLGGSVTEVAVEHTERRFGRSKYFLLRHRGLLDIISYKILLNFHWRPFHIFFEMGVICWVILLPLLSLVAYSLHLNDPALTQNRFILNLLVGLGVCTFMAGLLLPALGLALEFIISKDQKNRFRKMIKAHQDQGS